MLKIITSLSSSVLGLLAQAQVSDLEVSSTSTFAKSVETTVISAPHMLFSDNRKRYAAQKHNVGNDI